MMGIESGLEEGTWGGDIERGRGQGAVRVGMMCIESGLEKGTWGGDFEGGH